MTFNPTSRPEPGEHDPYFKRYIELVPDGNILDTMESQISPTVELLSGLSDAQAQYRYAPRKWSIKEMIGHVSDTERVFAYRALRYARRDSTPLPGFEQDGFVEAAGYDGRPLREIVDEFRHVRQSSLDLFRGFSEEAWGRRGKADDADLSVRALAWILCGHELHHGNLLRTKYAGAWSRS